MKRSGFKRKTYEEVKEALAKKAAKPRKPIARRTRLKMRSSSDISLIKEKIQATVREYVIIRDGGCILRNVAGVPPCNGYRKDGEMIYQADHLVTRSHSGSFADVRLIVCLCKGHHGWKSVGSNLRKKEYDEIVRQLLPKDRVSLWDRVEADQSAHRATRTGGYDWNLQLVGVQLQLADLKEKHEKQR